jgi:flavin reductase (DIM6/NTAB) family NADH-FMN oxidoreductase RutF
MALDKDFFRQVLGHFATGVTIATTRGQESLAGLTVNSFTSVSLNPPLVLICVDLRSQALPFLRESGVFAVNILTQEQEDLSNCFATSSEQRYTYFCHAEHFFAATGAPILKNTLGFVDARVTAEYPGGDHAIFLGQVEAMGYEGQVVFLSGDQNDQKPVTLLEDATDRSSSNGHGSGETPRAPLLYYRGQYHRLGGGLHHEQPSTVAVQAPEPA